MKACTIAGYEDLDSLTIDPDYPKPEVTEPGTLLIRTCAVSMAPGDVRVLSGRTTLMQAPDKFPYVPGGDSSGIVVAVHPEETRFRVGDRVACVFPEPRPFGALAEYRLAQTRLTAKVPDSVSMVDAATMPSSGVTAYSFKEHIRPGDRVVVVNSCGGVGCFLLQLLKQAFGASFVLAVTGNVELATSLGADAVVDRRAGAKWWEHPSLREDPADVILDLFGTATHWNAARSSAAVKPAKRGGRFVCIGMENPWPKVHHYWDAIPIVYSFMKRGIYSSMHKGTCPTHFGHAGLKVDVQERSEALLQLMGQGKVTAVVAKELQFDAASVREAFGMQKARKHSGKVVVRVADE
uniref:Enoyl reductase (ER) domain-containing protein n=1 Tax=Hemiselmis andersenii TaxID=464988 RepID=A0A6U4T0E9_HEMAN|mmetsp:Transcript_9022/g.21044  ORF Transcript_9022/g.21044 Transcript_9022/m.21044 type:complete len:351 (+) Transcript_9022:219-1271(+)